MRLIPFEIEFEKRQKTFLVCFFHIDWPEGDTSLLEIGWYQGEFVFDFLFWWGIKHRLIEPILEKKKV